jgi:enamine deaminase RidA (YjgF/YER057c/UK114 family)
MVQRIDTSGRFAKAVIANGMIYLAGITAKDRSGDAATQTQDVLAQIDALLASCGVDKSHVVLANIWLADIADFNAMNSIWDEWVDPDHKPVRATVESRLAGTDARVEIMVQAVQSTGS